MKKGVIIHDTSNKDEVRDGAMSISSQWNKLYGRLLRGMDSEENNEYYRLYTFAKELYDYYHLLIEENVFLQNGSINEYSKYLQSQKIELANAFKGLDRQRSKQKISQIVAIKKREWRLIYDAYRDNPIIKELTDFDYKKLEFKEIEIPF